jgi:beta-mannosidase
MNDVPPAVKVEELKAAWQFRQFGKNEWMKAQVPGTVHTDLMANGKIEDPFYRDNEAKVMWVEGEDWEYQTTFDIDKESFEYQNIDLIFNGLDTYADVYINDKLLKSSDNMFVGYTIPAKQFLVKGRNIMRVLFHSATNVGLKKLNESPYLVPAVNEYAPFEKRTSVFTRKAPFHYGWDWGPRLVTCGIWRPIQIKYWNEVKINSTYHELKKLYSHEADYESEVELESNDKGNITFVVEIDGKEASRETLKYKKGLNVFKLKFKIPSPKLWWPLGSGAQNLYEINVKALDGDELLDSRKSTIGVRTIQVVQEPDSLGTSFKFRVNGVDIFMKGSNYIPGDNFIPRVTTEKYEKVIKAATDANMNMIRVWGGAIYENDEFYDLCDKNGILVWQDFMFACSMSPGDDAHLKNLQSEFDYNVKRLRQHPSMGMWCGNNENMVAWFGWDLQKKFKLTSSDSTDIMMTYMKIFYEMIPNAIKKYDSTRYYWPSSPNGSYEYKNTQGPKSGDVHDWWIWFGKATAKDLISRKQRFISEYGLQSFPEMKTIKSIAIQEDLAYDSKLFDTKQRSEMPWIGKDSKGNTFNGNDMIAWYVENSYKKPSNFEHFVYLSQLVHAEELKGTIEGHRSHKPYCWGSMYWQINDCWPTVSWSSMDYYFRWKAAHYFVKKAYAEMVVYPVLKDGNVYVKVLSDRLTTANTKINFIAMDFSGKILAQGEEAFEIKPNLSKTYLIKTVSELFGKTNLKQALLLVSLKENDKIIAENTLYFDAVKNLELSKPNINTKISTIENGLQIELTSDVLAKNVYLKNDEIEGFFSDNFVDVFPGKPVIINYTSSENLSNFEKGLKVLSVRDTY